MTNKKCPKCSKEFVEIEKYLWKPTCKCYSDDLRLARL